MEVPQTGVIPRKARKRTKLPQQFFRTFELVEVLGMSRGTIKRMVDQYNIIPRISRGKVSYYCLSQFVNTQTK